MTCQECLHKIKLVAQREMRRMVSTPIYFFCMLVAPIISLVFLSL